MLKNEQNNIGLKHPGDGVRGRLLDAAEGIFADKGFAGTSIRDITGKANCNIAAINYYFGGKEDLYLTVFRRRLDKMKQFRLEAISAVMDGSNGSPTLESLLYGFARAFIESQGGPEFTNLIIREMLSPRFPREIFIEEYIRPVNQCLKEAIIKLCPQLVDDTAEMCVESILGQLFHAIRIRHIQQESGQNTQPNPAISVVIDHIVKFSIAGIFACTEKSINAEV